MICHEKLLNMKRYAAAAPSLANGRNLSAAITEGAL
ncbi:hypothetical protein FBZ94_11026 [Bradyrhizobium sacchari]|uniref:Uncharacterized protein n=1 Tax=Bradyrhizobium sacchari TaxID=1399419 RepID=A0A560HX16_9BRAD|nr:hypothetical protein FBZ94_11026 [Bradyrhizobium sacchari]TWB69430.1 hypothetical protein FBZ95_10926 [Bradyrhizobium sacchari]